MNPPVPILTAPKLARWLATRLDLRLIGIAGIPGAGKSTLAAELAEALPGSAIVPMDGYHLPRHALDAEGLRRRGAPFTFAPEALRADLRRLREAGAGVFPGWDHARKDPEAGAIRIGPEVTRVFVEGLYLLLREWRMESLFDVRVFAACELETALDRVRRRSLDCGIVASPAEAVTRAQANDLPNARLILADGGAERADFIIRTG